MKTTKIFGVVFEGEQFKAYELSELEGSGVTVQYVIQSTTLQINSVVKMLNDIKKQVA